MVDEGSNMVIEFDPAGRIVMTLGRKPEDVRVRFKTPGSRAAAWAFRAIILMTHRCRLGWCGEYLCFRRLWQLTHHKFDKNGQFIKSWGSKRTGTGQFDTFAFDGNGCPRECLYRRRPGNKRIQVFDNDGILRRNSLMWEAPTLSYLRGPHHTF